MTLKHWQIQFSLQSLLIKMVSSWCNLISLYFLSVSLQKYQYMIDRRSLRLRISSCMCNSLHGVANYHFQKQPSKGIIRKRCSKNMQQIYRRTPMSKCDFNKVSKQLCWNHTSKWVFSCNFVAYFQNTFS